jgi:hypothetical protein
MKANPNKSRQEPLLRSEGHPASQCWVLHYVDQESAVVIEARPVVDKLNRAGKVLWKNLDGSRAPRFAS